MISDCGVFMSRVDAWALPGDMDRKAIMALAKDEFPCQRVLKVMPFGFAWLLVLSPARYDDLDQANEPGVEGGGGEPPLPYED